jgi:hypothetical protein
MLVMQPICLNMGYKHDLRQQKKFRVLALDMLHICAEYELVT